LESSGKTENEIRDIIKKSAFEKKFGQFVNNLISFYLIIQKDYIQRIILDRSSIPQI
jgi:hypothetical protein